MTEIIGCDIDVSYSIVLPAFCHLLRVMEKCEDNLSCVAKIKSISDGSGYAKAEYTDRVVDEGGCMRSLIKKINIFHVLIER